MRQPSEANTGDLRSALRPLPARGRVGVRGPCPAAEQAGGPSSGLRPPSPRWGEGDTRQPSEANTGDLRSALLPLPAGERVGVRGPCPAQKRPKAPSSGLRPPSPPREKETCGKCRDRRERHPIPFSLSPPLRRGSG